MALDRNSNAFTFGFSIAMVIVVGSVLASLSVALKPAQLKNERDKKMMDILGAINVEADRKNAEELYNTYIVDSKVLNAKGEVIESDIAAFDIDKKKQFKNKKISLEERIHPLFIAEKDGERFYIMPMAGVGLWGPIWGFMSVGDDLSTIYGVRFAHSKETPGLGAEISSYDKFQKQWENKVLSNADGSFHPFLVSKTPADQSDLHAVDGITGGTITSKAVEEMVNRAVSVYAAYFVSVKQESVQ